MLPAMAYGAETWTLIIQAQNKLATAQTKMERSMLNITYEANISVGHIVQELYDFSRNKLQQKVSQRFLVNRGVLYDILKV